MKSKENNELLLNAIEKAKIAIEQKDIKTIEELHKKFEKNFFNFDSVEIETFLQWQDIISELQIGEDYDHLLWGINWYNQRILKAIYTVKGKWFFQELCELLEEFAIDSVDFEIIREKPKGPIDKDWSSGDFVKACWSIDYEPIEEEKEINKELNGGVELDTFHLVIRIKKNRYLKVFCAV